MIKRTLTKLDAGISVASMTTSCPVTPGELRGRPARAIVASVRPIDRTEPKEEQWHFYIDKMQILSRKPR